MMYCKQSTDLIHTLKHHCKSLKHIHQIHAQIITRGLLSLHPSSASRLLTSILHTFNSLLPAVPQRLHPISAHYPLSVFKLITNPSTFCWNTIIRSHTLLSLPENAVFFFVQMCQQRVQLDAHTFPFVLKACAQLNDISLVGSIHCQCFKHGFMSDVFVCNNLVCVCCNCGWVGDAYKVFDESTERDVVSYNVILDGFVKAKEIERARRVFDEMDVSVRDKTTWGTMLAGYAQIKDYNRCLNLYDQMLVLGVVHDNVSLVAVLSACGRMGKLEKGKEVHEHIIRSGNQIDSFLCTALVDFYAKCGCIETAGAIFEACPGKNLFTWNAMLVGLAMHGYGDILLTYFSKMVKNRVKPDGVTFLGVLVGCSHAGLINEARRLFSEMGLVYGVPKELKHYGCMADLLARAGLIKEAVDMIESMPMSGDVFVWGSLLGGCRLHGNVEVAEKAAARIMEISPEDGGVYSTMADIYANAKRWDDLTKIRRLRDSRRVKKNAGCNFLFWTSKGAYVPVYISLGLILMSASIGTYTATHQLKRSPNVFVKKSKRETLPELVEPEKVAEESEEFIKKSFFRKIAHVQDADRQDIMHDPIQGDTYAMHPKPYIESLKSVGVEVEKKPFVEPPPLKH